MITKNNADINKKEKNLNFIDKMNIAKQQYKLIAEKD